MTTGSQHCNESTSVRNVPSGPEYHIATLARKISCWHKHLGGENFRARQPPSPGSGPRADPGPRPNNSSLEKRLEGPFLGCPPGPGVRAPRAAGASPL